MAQKTYIVDGRQFRTEADYRDAMRDQELIEKLRRECEGADVRRRKAILEKLERREIVFRTMLGTDFEDELREQITRAERKASGEAERAERIRAERRQLAQREEDSTAGRTTRKQETVRQQENMRKDSSGTGRDAAFEGAVRRELKKREKRRKLALVLSGCMAVFCLGFCLVYAVSEGVAERRSRKLGELLSQQQVAPTPLPGGDPIDAILVNKTQDGEPPEVLEEYKTVYLQHKKLIGWLKFDDKDIGGEYGFPVMQTEDNEFFLSHDVEQKPDKRGTIFMDKDCDVVRGSTNYILYGHHMKSGAMFGNLDRYEDKDYWEKYPYIQFDTIYEKGVYQVMYVFRSRVYGENEIVFKYYQFIDATGATEFDSYMDEMSGMSLYDTGVTAQYGDRLLTLSTCDYQETNGRFVVVAKKVDSRN